MKSLHILLFLVFFKLSTHSQIAWFDPSPAGWNQEVTLYIDVNMSGGNSNDALREILIAHPESLDEVHIWIWQPSDPIVGNGNWTDSNDALLMTWVNDLVFSFSFIPSQFFDVDEAQFTSLGIACLAKLDNGSPLFGEFVGEAKTEDIHLSVSTSIDARYHSLSTIILYPNPASSVVYLLSDIQEILSIYIYDSTGKIVFSRRAPFLSKLNGMAIDVSTLRKGLYFLKIETENSNMMKKLEII